MAHAEGPFCITSATTYQQRHKSYNGTDAYTVPASVDGGARKSAFSRSTGMFWGPSMLAPSDPRIASGTMLLVSVQSRPLESSDANATVALAGAKDTTDDGRGALSAQRAAARRHAYTQRLLD